ncbi:hypothetical protein L7F22_035802 [Adiantum nelumboides]|nr:hypothetical protein [Adiantum nelumboides]
MVGFQESSKGGVFFGGFSKGTKQIFVKWIKQNNKGIYERELLQEFEKKYDQLFATDQRSIRSKQVELFVQAADAHLQKSLEQLLEDDRGELGLTSNLKLVLDATIFIVKQQMRVDKLIVVDCSKTSDEEVKDKLATLKHKLEEPNRDDLVKGWFDPVDLFLVYAYIAKSEANEAWFQEKRKRDEEAARSFKRATRSSNKKEEVPKHLPEVNMEEPQKDKKQGKPRAPFYKLKSDIELATNLKKVFEERILKSKLEMTLGDILGISKCKFCEDIIDIIKRKWQIQVTKDLKESRVK